MGQPLPPERHRRILDVLRDRQAVRVSTLASLLEVSEVTIRRDLEDLESRSLLERTHGGAISVHRMQAEPAYSEATGRFAEQKRLIGAAAAMLVEPGDTVFLNGGTTTLQVFRHLPATARVVTNHVGMALESGPRETIVVGGEFRPASNSLVGPFATEAVRKVFATRSFIGVEGVSARSGLTTPAGPEAEIARVMIEQTQQDVVVVADHSKIGVVADFGIAPLSIAHAILTDCGLADDAREALGDSGLRVLIAEELLAAGEVRERVGG